MATETQDRPVAYYDGACRVCAREVAFWRGRPGGEAIAWVDVARPDAAPGPGLTRDAALARMHVRLPDGRLVAGARAFAVIWGAMPGFRWLGRLIGWPLVAPLAEAAYRGFLAVRRLWRRPSRAASA
ncbi:MAG: thiol-disulfide oxidoreductase DCC family protein [Elioraea tepidiphila]